MGGALSWLAALDALDQARIHLAHALIWLVYNSLSERERERETSFSFVAAPMKPTKSRQHPAFFRMRACVCAVQRQRVGSGKNFACFCLLACRCFWFFLHVVPLNLVHCIGFISSVVVGCM